jgi:hypothetical protein
MLVWVDVVFYVVTRLPPYDEPPMWFKILAPVPFNIGLLIFVGAIPL